jgi:hypothetical protein
MTGLPPEIYALPIRAIVYVKEPDFWNKGCQVKSTDTGFRRCLLSRRGPEPTVCLCFFHGADFFSQRAGKGETSRRKALTRLWRLVNSPPAATLYFLTYTIARIGE